MKTIIVTVFLSLMSFNVFAADCTGDNCPACSTAPFYKTDGVTLEQTLNKKMSEMRNASFSLWVKNFFNMHISGACPTWQTDLPFGSTGLQITFQCHPTFTSALQIAGNVLMILAALAAVRIVLL